MQTHEEKIKTHWDNQTQSSMYDKNLLDLEIKMVSGELSSDDVLLDLGCGEGEGTEQYIKLVKEIVAADYSETRLEMLVERIPEISPMQFDMRDLNINLFEKPFSVVVTQRSLINLMDTEQQFDVIRRIHSVLKNDGRYIMVEAFRGGSRGLNELREFLGLSPIKEKWHNLFLEEEAVIRRTKDIFRLVRTVNMSAFLFLTRVINAAVKHPEIPKWDDKMNDIAKKIDEKFPNLMNFDCSRIKMLVLEKL